MKQLLAIACTILASHTLTAQTPACCIPPRETSGIVAFANTDAFKMAHESPEPLEYKQRGSDISFNTLDGKKGRAYFVPSSEPTTRTLLIFHEWWGLNDYIRREADRWQDSLGPVDVYALDLYDGKLATTPEDAARFSGSLDERRTDVLIKGLLVTAGKDDQIVTLGWCMGGSYAFRASVLAEKQAAGCVMYYGFPEKDAKKMAALQTDVLYIWGSQDKFITRDIVTAFEKLVTERGRKITVETYDAAHAFANPSNPHHDPNAASAAEQKALTFIRSHLVL